MTRAAVIRIEEAGLGPDAPVRLVLSDISDVDRLHRAWASSGAAIDRRGDRLHATTTVEALVRAAGRAFGKADAQHMDVAVRDAVAAWAGPAPAVPLPGGGVLGVHERTLVMGVVNVTPDSFSDGGLYPDGHPERAIALGRRLVDEGADLLDVGGESTRPGSDPVAPDEQIRRVVPVLEGLAGAGVPLSVDTTSAEVARAAVDAGAVVVNDVSGLAGEDLLDLVAGTGVAYVLMHTRGTPKDMQQQAVYDDVVGEVYEHLAANLQRCTEAGIARERVLVDPGLGFAKTAAHNLALLRHLRQLLGLGRPVLVGASRKSFIGSLLDGAGVEQRLEGSLACAVSAVASGAAIVRAHDVAATVRAVRVAQAIVDAGDTR